MSGDPSQAGIPRPHHVAFGNSRIQEMSIDQSDAAAVKVPLVNEGEDFFVGGLAGPRQSVEQFEDLMPFGKGSAGEFTDYKRVAHHFAGFQPDRQVAVAPPKMVDPDRCIDKDHIGFLQPGLRRGATRALRSEPPRTASFLAASRAISASRPMRTSSVFLRMPVRREAVEIALSSMLRVVRMHQFLQYCMHPSSDAVRSEEKPGRERRKSGTGANFAKQTESLRPSQ